MGNFGGFYSGEKKKKKKKDLEEKTRREMFKKTHITPTVEIIGKGKKI